MKDWPAETPIVLLEWYSVQQCFVEDGSKCTCWTVRYGRHKRSRVLITAYCAEEKQLRQFRTVEDDRKYLAK